MDIRINICSQVHKNGIVSINISIPPDKSDKECEKGIRVNREIKNYKETDLGYEIGDISKIWYDSEDEGCIYDNLD